MYHHFVGGGVLSNDNKTAVPYCATFGCLKPGYLAIVLYYIIMSNGSLGELPVCSLRKIQPQTLIITLQLLLYAKVDDTSIISRLCMTSYNYSRENTIAIIIIILSVSEK